MASFSQKARTTRYDLDAVGGGVGAAFALAVFGWLRYYWAQHHVGWRPDSRFWQYGLPLGGLVAIYLLSRGPAGRRTSTRLLQSLHRTWLAGVVGAALALAQLALSPQEPWLLYAWMVVLAWAGWRISRRAWCLDFRIRGPWLWIVLATTAFVVIHVNMQLQMWWDLSFGYHDIGLFARALHSAAAGRGLWVDSLGRSILGEHTCFVMWLLAPICKLGVDPFHLLVFASAICLDGPALIVGWFARRRFGSDQAALIAALAWLFLPAHGCLVLAQGYGFHEVYLAVPLLVAGLALSMLGFHRRAAVYMLACLAVREDLALTVAAWGAYVFFAERRRWTGGAVFAAAIAYLSLAIQVIIPHYRGGPYPHIASNFRLANLLTAAGSLPLNLSFLATLLLPLGGLPLRNWRWSCMALPALVEVLLTTNPDLHNTCFQYCTPAVAVLFFAALDAWRRSTGGSGGDSVSARKSMPRRREALLPQYACFLLWCALAGQLYLGVGPLTNNPAAPFSSPALRGTLADVHRIRSMIAENASVTASYRIAAHFLGADRLYTVRNESLGDLVIVHDADRDDASEPRTALVKAMTEGEHQPLWADYHLVALIRSGQPTPLARELMPPARPGDVESVSLDLGQGVELVGLKVGPVADRPDGLMACRVAMVWRATSPVQEDYRFGLTLGNDDVRWGPFYFARGAVPTPAWVPGRLYRDDITLVVEAGWRSRLSELRPVLLK